MLKLHYKKIGFWIFLIIFATTFVYFNWIREPELNIYHADYLDELDGGSYVSHKKTFIVEEPLFYRAKCTEIEKWVQDNQTQLLQDKRPINTYEFLRYDDKISLKNAFLHDEHNAIAWDYLICHMNTIDKKCYSCHE